MIWRSRILLKSRVFLVISVRLFTRAVEAITASASLILFDLLSSIALPATSLLTGRIVANSINSLHSTNSLSVCPCHHRNSITLRIERRPTGNRFVEKLCGRRIPSHMTHQDVRVQQDIHFHTPRSQLHRSCLASAAASMPR